MPNNTQQPSSGGDSRHKEPDGLALVPNPPGALQRSAPGAKHILSGMVADALALAVKKHKPDRAVRFVLVGDENETISWMFDFGPQLTQMRDFEGYEFVLINFSSGTELLKLVQEHVFDLIVINLSSINWDKPYPNGGDSFDDVIEFLALIRTQYGKPIIVFSSIADARFSPERFAQIGVNFHSLPCTPEQVRAAFEACLIGKSSEEILQPHQMRSRKIIHLDDADDLLDLHRAIIQRAFKNVEVVSFTDANAALQELSRATPVLFITDLNMPKIDGFQVLSTLAEKGVKYPVMMLCGNMSDDVVKRAHEIAGPAMNFTYRLYPGSGDEISQFIQAVSKLIGVEPDLSLLPPARPLIYIVDDEDWLLEMIRLVLEPLNYRIYTFGVPEMLLESFIRAERRPDLIITNLNMPKMDGLELIKQLRQIEPEQKFLMMSGMADEKFMRIVREMGGEFLPKPFKVEELVQIVSSLLEHPLASHE